MTNEHHDYANFHLNPLAVIQMLESTSDSHQDKYMITAPDKALCHWFCKVVYLGGFCMVSVPAKNGQPLSGHTFTPLHDAERYTTDTFFPSICTLVL